MADRTVNVKHRDLNYEKKYPTAIFKEVASDKNPFIEKQLLCHGYDLQEIAENLSYVDCLFLLLTGGLANTQQRNLMNRLMIGLCHPGVRTESARAAILAGVGKTHHQHVLPIALTVYGGDKNGVGKIESMMEFFNAQRATNKPYSWENDFIPPCFDNYYGDVDIRAQLLVDSLLSDYNWPCLSFGQSLLEKLPKETSGKVGWSKTGVAAAAFCDLGIDCRYSAALMQMIAAPGLLIQGLENSNKSSNIHPFVDDSKYKFKGGTPQ